MQEDWSGQQFGENMTCCSTRLAPQTGLPIPRSIVYLVLASPLKLFNFDHGPTLAMQAAAAKAAMDAGADGASNGEATAPKLSKPLAPDGPRWLQMAPDGSRWLSGMHRL